MKRATWFLVTEDFIPGFRVLWRSLLQHNPRDWFGDVVIQTDVPDKIPCDGLQPARCWPLDLSPYANWPAFQERVHPCYAKLEALTCNDYDQITVMDCDMVCTGALDVLRLHESFLAIGTQFDNPLRRFNGGFWQARHPVIGNAEALNEISEIVYKGGLFDESDQSALWQYLTLHKIDWGLASLRYNLQTGWAAYGKLRPLYLGERHDCRLLHFTGDAKPWNARPNSMGWRERFRPLWERAAAGITITAADVVAVDVEN